MQNIQILVIISAVSSLINNYNTFSNAFKLLMGQTVTDWIKSLQ